MLVLANDADAYILEGMGVEKLLLSRFLMIVFTIIVVVYCIQSAPVTQYVEHVKEASSLPDHRNLDEVQKMKQKIQAEANKHYQRPIDARIDPIWKAIPGYNGRIVDEEATVQQTLKQSRKRSIIWVYREVEPAIQLENLGAVPIYRGNPAKPAAAIMVNVAWGTEHLPAYLNILKQEKIKATFFLDGSWLQKHPREAKIIQKHGHEIGNHAFSHPMMSRLSVSRMDQEIGKTEKYINEILKVKSRWFAPPAGDYNQQVVNQAYKYKMNTVLWTVDTVDWKKSSSPEWMIRRVEQQLGNGSLLLTHPTDRTVKALPEMIRIGKRKGIKWGTVSEVLSSKRINPIE